MPAPLWSTAWADALAQPPCEPISILPARFFRSRSRQRCPRAPGRCCRSWRIPIATAPAHPRSRSGWAGCSDPGGSRRRRQVDPEGRSRALDEALHSLLKPVGVTSEGIGQRGGELSLDRSGPSRSCPSRAGSTPRPMPRVARVPGCPELLGAGLDDSVSVRRQAARRRVTASPASVVSAAWALAKAARAAFASPRGRDDAARSSRMPRLPD